LLDRFGDAEITALISPRRLIIEHSPTPTITGHKGEWKTPPFSHVAAEFDRIGARDDVDRPILVDGENSVPSGPYSEVASSTFLDAMGVRSDTAPITGLRDGRGEFDPEPRQQRAVQQLEDHVQQLVRNSDHVRDQFMLYQLMPEIPESRWSTLRR